jgi:hypothetical protein
MILHYCDMSGRAAILVAACLGATLGACGETAPPLSAPPPTTWTMILESATVADPGLGVAPSVYVDALVAGETFESVAATSAPGAGGFDASWGTPLFAGDQAALQDGIDLQVWADFGNGAELAGEIIYRPTVADFGAGVIDLGSFMDVADLIVELTPN